MLFLWKALNGGIAVKAILGHIMHREDICNVCNCQPETIDHALLHCYFATAVWRTCSFPVPSNFNLLSLQDFITRLMSNDVDDFRKGCAILWSIWKARNTKVFNNRHTEASAIIRHAVQLHRDYYTPASTPMNHPTVQSSIIEPARQLHWSLPGENFVKINFDGSCINGRIAAGIVARDHTGVCIGGHMKVDGYGSPLESEAMACRLALHMVERLSLANVMIEGDSKSIIDSINNRDLTSDWRIKPTITACRTLLTQRSDISFIFTPRANNTVAHAMASHAITHEVNDHWSGGLPPPFLLDYLFYDLANNVANISLND